ncbi:HlyD family secretion protein [Taibaiella soli]|uniref:HlyD family secretion protein n=1 Tax=Taibaiella soli TaxID=1649169 RepID=A0A2W2AGP3_9BACT|nr:HlyD family efflux transporter periplasmic adaptor subunit [Taibaiella soli]PZF74431.1 hypothetical protein DN068_02300 [Taibaiella soli]
MPEQIYNRTNIDELPAAHLMNEEETAPVLDEIISSKPGYLVRKGTAIIMVVLGLLIAGAGFIHYPDVLEGAVMVTTDPLPIELKAQASGRVERLFIHENDLVAKNTVIAEIENNTGLQNIQILEERIDSILSALQQNDLIVLNRFTIENLQSLGDGQTAYNQLLQNLSAYLLVKQQHVFGKRMDNIQLQNSQYQKLAVINKEETELINSELKQAAEQFKANEKLYNEKVISRQEYFDEAAKLRQKQLSLEQQKRGRVQNSINISDNSKQLFEMTYNKEEKENTLILGIREQIRNLQNFTTTWRRQFLITAPYSGNIYWLRPLQSNELVNAGEALFSIVPDKFHYLAYVQLSANGLGKIKKAQTTHLLLDHFPYNEYGYLKGTVTSVSMIPQSPGTTQEAGAATYRAIVALPDSLVTSYHKKIPFSPEMSGTARIITKDRNLLERLLSFLAKVEK